MADGYGLAAPAGWRYGGAILAGDETAKTESQGGNRGGREQRQDERAVGCRFENEGKAVHWMQSPRVLEMT